MAVMKEFVTTEFDCMFSKPGYLWLFCSQKDSFEILIFNILNIPLSNFRVPAKTVKCVTSASEYGQNVSMNEQVYASIRNIVT